MIRRGCPIRRWRWGWAEEALGTGRFAGLWGTTAVANARSLGLPFRLAALCDRQAPSWLASLPDFASPLAQINRAMVGTGDYLGVAVEDYTSWAAMKGRHG
jgi:hypothetical protein